MPMNLKDYPADWREVSKQIRSERAGGMCEQCGIPNYAVGQRTAEGEFLPAIGDEYADTAGAGGFSYKQARDFALELKAIYRHRRRYIVVVLTVAHLCDCRPLCSNPDHLKALCQQCHLRLDARQHAENAARTRAARRIEEEKEKRARDLRRKGLVPLFEEAIG